MSLLQNVTNVTGVLRSRCRMLQGVTERYRAVKERHITVTENINFAHH